ncbi:hypothetical protein GALMADRAFT_241328 [Galerina marginata CBS 339.88]|uniref:Uncharacterized protein n=1 Tax=Galerina marginata (strain CBS 339.88) TaxID=685588 RepID=A0A067TLR5_GALM3|nr:hypothetical protein GALMADRAFT_241328 [Galerina marginata CBS 339.88]
MTKLITQGRRSSGKEGETGKQLRGQTPLIWTIKLACNIQCWCVADVRLEPIRVLFHLMAASEDISSGLKRPNELNFYFC